MAAQFVRRLTNTCTGYSGPNREVGWERLISVSTVDAKMVAVALHARESGVEHEDMGLAVTRAGARELAETLLHAVDVLHSDA